MQIPTILKGDDSGSIVLVMDQDHDYAGATLVVAYSGVTRTFTDLTPGGTVSLAFTHDETSGFKLGCKPVLMRLIGPSGAVETVENAEMKIKVTDCLGEVNAGGSFAVRPGASTVPVTDIGDIPDTASVSALYEKVNAIVRVLAQRSLLALAVLLSTAAFAAVQTTTLGNLNPSSVVVTNVVESAAIDTNAVREIALAPATNYTDRATGEVVRLVGDLAYSKRDKTDEGCYNNVVVRWNGVNKPGFTLVGQPYWEGSKWYWDWEEQPDDSYRAQSYDNQTNPPTEPFEFWIPEHGDFDFTATPVRDVVTDPSHVLVRRDKTAANALAKFDANGNLVTAAATDIGKIADTNGNEIAADGSVKKVETYADWTPIHTPIPENPEENDVYYGYPYYENIPGGYVWWCTLYRYGRTPAGFVWVEDGYRNLLVSETPNPDATELTFPDGTKTYRKRTIQYTLALTSDLTTSVQRVERKLDDKADASDLAPVAADAASALTYSKFVYDFCLGSASCHLITTNYVFGSDATNRTRFAWQPDMDAATVPSSMRLVDIVGGETNVVWDSRDWTVWYWNYRLAKYRAERAAEDDALRELIASRCPTNWASYTACGLTNPAATTTWLDTPSVVLSAGYAWQHQLDVGGVGYWCIEGNGFEVGGSGTNATLKISDFEGNEVFKIRKGNAMLAPVSSEMTEAVGFDGDWFWCDMKCDAQPEGEFAVDLADGFYPEGDTCPAVVREYEDRGGGVWRCYWKVRPGIQSASCFGRFKVQVGSETTVEYSNAPTFPAIRFGNYKLEPVIPTGASVGDTVTFKITEITQ